MTRPCDEPGYELLGSMHRSARERLVSFGLGCLFGRHGKPLVKDERIIEAIDGGSVRIKTLLSETGFDGDVDDVLAAISEGRLLQTWLSPERQLEISRAVAIDVPAQTEFDKRPENQYPELEYTDKRLSNPQWLTLATTPAIPGQPSGHRISFSFYKTPCLYRETTPSGCSHCALSAFMPKEHEVTTEQQLKALRAGLAEAHEFGGNFTVFEMLPDGSFLSSKEVPVATQVGMMQILSEEPSVKTVAVESRPEYCKPQNVLRLLENLRPDQNLKLYMGLESTDNGVAALSVRKGYGFDEFKDALRALKETLTPEQMARVHLSAYNLMKPPYLTEQEAIEDSIKTTRDVYAFSQEIDVPIEVTCEPCVITKTTRQNYLYHQKDETDKRRYEPLSYFSAAEFIARLIEENLHHIIKFGQRDDIDPFTVVAMIMQLGEEHLFSPFDFMVYNAVQRFNVHRSIRGFALDLQIAVDHSPEFKEWEEETCGGEGESALSRLINDMQPVHDDEVNRMNFQKGVWKVCDQIEYTMDFSTRLRAGGSSIEDEVKSDMRTLFETAGIRVVQIKDLTFIDNRDKDEERLPDQGTADELKTASVVSAYQLEIVIFNEANQPQSVWLKIPLIAPEAMGSPEEAYPFIYQAAA